MDNFGKIFASKNELRLLDLMAGILIGLAPLVHIIVVKKITIPYGRYSRPSWGVLINVRLAWFLQELPSFVIPLCVMYTSSAQLSLPGLILLVMFLGHYFNRTFVYSYKIRGGKDTPVSIALMAGIFCFYNGYMQSVYLARHSHYSEDWICTWNFMLGVCLFFWGMVKNMECDSILRNLRKPGETGYKIPKGGLFEYVSCGNLFAESVEWAGFALATWSLQGVAFAIFTSLMLSARSYNHHEWYQKKFDNYPKERKIFLPFLL